MLFLLVSLILFYCHDRKTSTAVDSLFIYLFLNCRWEDNGNNDGSQRQSASHGRSCRSSSSSRRGGRSRGQRATETDGVAFVSATGERVSGRCYVCGDPSHFANVCPNRGR